MYYVFGTIIENTDHYYDHGNIHFQVLWVLLKLFLWAKGPHKAGLPEYMNVTPPWQDDWEAQSPNVFGLCGIFHKKYADNI